MTWCQNFMWNAEIKFSTDLFHGQITLRAAIVYVNNSREEIYEVDFFQQAFYAVSNKWTLSAVLKFYLGTNKDI